MSGDTKCASALVRAAGRDVEVLRLMAGEGSEEVFGFHVQQAAEKYLKSWIAALGVTYPLTHDIQQLLGVLTAQGVNANSCRGLTAYTSFAVVFRYPDADPEFEPIVRDDALVLLDSLANQVEAALRTAEGS